LLGLRLNGDDGRLEDPEHGASADGAAPVGGRADVEALVPRVQVQDGQALPPHRGHVRGKTLGGLEQGSHGPQLVIAEIEQKQGGKRTEPKFLVLFTGVKVSYI
jgi:hypothetical protein